MHTIRERPVKAFVLARGIHLIRTVLDFHHREQPIVQ
jgi:hypothetical protein